MSVKKIFIFLVIAIVIGSGIKFGLKGSLYVDKRLIALKEASDTASLATDLQKVATKETAEQTIACDVVIVGGGAGGTGAAISAAREGAKTCLVEETDWLGGMITSAGVAAIDGRQDTPSGIFKEFIDRVGNYYREIGQEDKIHNCNVSYLCFEPSVGSKILKEMAEEESNLQVFYNSVVNKVYRDGNKILGIRFTENNNKNYIVNAAVTIDATEFGDLMYSANVPYDLGLDQNSTESLTQDADQCIQPLTYVAILKKGPKPAIIEKPANYDREKYKCVVDSPLCPDSNSRFDVNRLLSYGRMPNNKLMINIPSHSYGNDFHATTPNLENFSRAEIMEEAKNYSKGLIYFLQTEMGFEYFDIHNEFETADKFAKIPYVRESRRLKGVKRLTQDDIVKGNGDERSLVSEDAIAIGDYPIDLHFCQYGIGDVYKTIAPYQIPYGVTVPKNIDGFMVADKNISVSHIVNGTTRLQPVVMSVGQAVGTASAMAARQHIEPRNVDVEKLQKKLLENKSTLFFFKDLSPSDYAYKYAANLAIKGLISGYGDFTFRPNNPITEDVLYKLFKSFLFLKNQDESLMSDTGISDNSNTDVKRSAMANYIYNLLNSANKIDQNINSELSFNDVKANSDLYDKLSKLAAMGIINGDKPNFKPNDKLTRGEAIVLLGRAFDVLGEN